MAFVGWYIQKKNWRSVLIFSPQVAFEGYETLPDEPSFSSEATLSVEDASIAEVEFEHAEEGRIHIDAHKYGETTITVSDKGKDYKYTIIIYDDNGVDRARLSPAYTDYSSPTSDL